MPRIELYVESLVDDLQNVDVAEVTAQLGQPSFHHTRQSRPPDHSSTGT